MKKLIIGLSLCALSSMAAAALVCTTGTAGPGTAITGDPNNFVKTSFTPRCSANTRVDFLQNASTGAAGSISTKGNQVFSGHSNGAAVAGVACAAAACVEGEATTAATTALAAGSSL